MKIKVLFMMLLAVIVSLPVSAATVLQYDFETDMDGNPGVDGALLNPSDSPAASVPDISGNGNHMWIWNDKDISYSADTIDGTGLSANLNNYDEGYIETLNSWSPLSWTIDVSVKFNTGERTRNSSMICRDGDSTGGTTSDFILRKTKNEWLECSFATINAGRVEVFSDFQVTLGVWYKISIVCDGLNLTMYCDKLDGNGYVVVGTTVLTGTPADNAFPATETDNINWVFGRHWWGTDTGDGLSGYIDDVKFSDGESSAGGAHDPNPTPDNGDGTVGTLDGTDALVTLNWMAGSDPNEATTGNAVNPEILTHYIWLSPPGDPNLANITYLDSVTQSSLVDPNVSYGPIRFNGDETYYWSIEEGLNDGTGTPYPAGSPNNIAGPLWSFDTISAIPAILVDPINDTADPDASFTVTASSSATVYQWYKATSPGTALTDIGPFSGTQTATLTVTNAALAEEGQYYCIAYNGLIPSVPSASAQLWLQRLMGHWKFEGNMLDSVTDTVSGAPVHDGSIVISSAGGDSILSYAGAGSGVDGVGNAISFNNDGDFVAISDSDFFNFYPQGFTASFWYKAKDPLTAWVIPMSKLDVGVAGWLIGTDHLYPAPNYTFILESPWYRLDGGATPDIGDGQWHLMTVTYDPVDTTIRAFTDGDEDSSLVLDISAAPLAAAPLSIGGRDTELSINGEIDDVKIFSYALTPAQVAQEYVNYNPSEWICLEDTNNPLIYDLSGDCRVTLEDFAMFAAEWLGCGRIPATSCLD